MRLNQLRRTFLLKTMVASATVVFPSMLIAEKMKTNPEPVDHIVEIYQFEYVPASVNIRYGDTITWINKDIAPHTATASDGSWDTGEIKMNQSKTVTIDNDSINSYYCFYHPMMKAKISIRR